MLDRIIHEGEINYSPELVNNFILKVPMDDRDLVMEDILDTLTSIIIDHVDVADIAGLPGKPLLFAIFGLPVEYSHLHSTIGCTYEIHNVNLTDEEQMVLNQTIWCGTMKEVWEVVRKLERQAVMLQVGSHLDD